MYVLSAISLGWRAFRTVLRKRHVFVIVASLDDHSYNQYARNISVEAIGSVINHNINIAVEQGYMTINATPEEKLVMDARAREYEEKRKRGEL